MSKPNKAFEEIEHKKSVMTKEELFIVKLIKIAVLSILVFVLTIWFISENYRGIVSGIVGIIYLLFVVHIYMRVKKLPENNNLFMDSYKRNKES